MRLTLLLAIALLGACKPSADDAAPPRDPGTGTYASKEALIVTSVRQSSFGATADDIDADFVAMLEDHFRDETKKQYITAMKNMGHPRGDIDLEVTTTMFDEQGEKLAITTVTFDGKGASTKIAWWIIEGEIRRTVCVSPTGDEVPVRFGSCAAKIAEVFGYENWVLDGTI